MNFNRKRYEKEQEDKSFDLLPPGDYDFEIKDAKHKVSDSTGSIYWQFMLRCTDGTHTANVFDNILERENFEWKWGQLFDSIGEDLEDTADAENLIGEVGRVRIQIETKPGYDDRNTVKRYLKKAKVPELVNEKKSSRSKKTDDDLPF